MTHAVPLTSTVPSKYLPPCVTLADWIEELTHLWTYVDETGDQAMIDACTALFAKYPGAQQNELQASDLVREIRPLLGLLAEPQAPSRPGLPFVNTPLATPRAQTVTQSGTVDGEETHGPGDEQSVETSEDEAGEADEPEYGGEDQEGAQAQDTPGEEADASAEPSVPAVLTLSSGEPQWPDELLGQGLISGLAATLKPKEMVQLIIARVGNELRVTVQPSKIEGESDRTCLALQVMGSPQQLDLELLDAMAGYQQVRQTARQATDALLAQVQAGAAASKQSAAKAASKTTAKAPVKPVMPQDGKSPVGLSVKMDGKAPDQRYRYEFVSDTRANNLSGDSQQASASVRLKPGTYMLTVSSDRYVPATKTVVVEQGKSPIVHLDLKPNAGSPGLF